ncbi:hypothetical protein PLEOSDRAFT_156256 [Pleurotus ostreatus PC15]|uniref:Major facilitator superfamily (MFS) profile domain-containing protein n=1 Tax=Pleurotus ostreatus (strain PC15) TaxID=1137138 RepID=A0A067NUJ9_PLEO1|nr:hypothetical protein PLEOSDRAFT_156256 [Pleurotus ostreatus PC15]
MSASVCTRELADADGGRTGAAFVHLLPNLYELGVTHGDEAKVGYYVGLIESLFFVTRAITVLHWSRMSDWIGRKPVILPLEDVLGLNLERIDMMAEMTDSSNISRAYAWVPISRSTGSTLAPMIGGSLSHPAERFPRLFGRSRFLQEYPYFLPCGISPTFAFIAWLVTYFFLKETLAVKISFASPKWVRRRKERATPDHDADVSDNKVGAGHLPLHALLIKPVLTTTASYAALALVDIAYRAVQPLFLSSPIALGGLGWPPSDIGKLLATWGILNGLFTACFFARIHGF